MVFAVHPSVPAKTVAEFVAYAKSQGSRFTFSSGGAGSMTHLVGAQFGQSVGLDFVHVPYQRRAGPAVAAAVAGHVPAVFSSMPPAVPHITEGRLRALAVTGKRALAFAARCADHGGGGLRRNQGRSMGRRVRAGRIRRRRSIAVLNREIAKAVANPDVKERFATVGFVPVGNTPEELRGVDPAARRRTWSKVIRAGNLKPD